tara:strand:+ start:460 stop:1443 length:984 start_codon:yes stop_codon:yes gene_type:complete
MKHTRNIDTALIGCGYWGTNIAKSLLKIKKSIYVYDLSEKNAKILKKRFPSFIIIEKNLNNILNNRKIKKVILATPPSKNFKLLKILIKNKKNIFVEKPGLKNLHEINLVKKIINKQIIMFGYIYMFNNYINFIKKFITNPKNGKVLYLKFQRQNLGPIRNDISVSYDLSSHDLSILYFFIGILPKSIKENSYDILKKKVPDISNLSIKYRNIFIDIHNSWLNPDKVRRITVVTEKKMLLFDEMKDVNKITIYNKYASYPDISEFDNKFFNKKAKIYNGRNYSPKIRQNNSLLDELKYFFKCVKQKNIPFTDINFAIKILRVLKKIS